MESCCVLRKFTLLFYILLISQLILINYADAQEKGNDVESKAKEFLAKLNVQSAEMANKVSLASWNYDTNLTDYNQNEMMEATMRNAKFVKDSWVEVVKFPWTTFKDPDLKRQFKFFARLGTPALPEEKLQRFTNLTSTMQSNYGKAKVCEYKNPSNCTIPLDPSLTDIFTKSRDPEELKHYWIEWRKEAGIPCRPLFKEYVGLSNEAARLNNFTSNTEFWLEDFESDEFENDVQKLWEQTQPLYKELHAYVRFKLRQTYGDIVPENGAIPAHILGDMWGQTWSNILNITTPFPNKPSTDVTENIQKAGYTPLKMFKLSEEFQTSLNLTAMPQSFWEKSIIEKPADDRELVCHASAYEFQDGKDFRIKMCAQANMEDLLVIHHEMGHIQYYIQYRNLPFIYRNGANSGFHEAVGDTLALSVVTPDHLRTINLLDKNYKVDQESDLNFLYLSALTKVAFLPYSLLLDSWRWAIFRDQIKPENYNCKYWDLRWKLQGLEPPVDRSENDFDPGAKFHVAGDVPYIRYFVSFIVQFQFYKSLCIKAGQYDPHNPYTKPLHQCDYYRSVEAGNAFASMLSMGNSKPWPDAMEVLTGERKMDASALLEYFAPLQKFLEKENKKNGVVVGWDNAKPQKSCK